MYRQNTVLDLFAGIGGMSLAAQMAGFNVISAIDNNTTCSKTYNLNFDTKIFINKDVNEIQIDKLPNIDIVTGRIPPTSFLSIKSSFNKFNSWTIISEILQRKKPRAFFFVMYPSFRITNKNENDFLEELQKDYKISYKDINSGEILQMPVYEQRTYVIGIHRKEYKSFEFCELECRNPLTIKDLLYEREACPKDYKIPESLIKEEIGREGSLYSWKKGQYEAASKIVYSHRIRPLVETDKGIRKINNREIARAKCFPDEFKLYEKDKEGVYRSICSSVNVLIAYDILTQLYYLLNDSFGTNSSSWNSSHIEVDGKNKKDLSDDNTIEERNTCTDNDNSKVNKINSLDEIVVSEHKINSEDREENKRRIFLSYCQKDSDIADLVEERLNPFIKNDFSISRDKRNVKYLESFKQFMKSIRDHDFVIMIISDRYIKSRNCMYEVMEFIKSKQYKDKILFIVLDETDKKFYKGDVQEDIGARVYGKVEQSRYQVYWKDKLAELDEVIRKIGNHRYTTAQIRESQRIEKIILELPEFLEYIEDAKGLPLEIHLNSDFLEIRKVLEQASEK